MKNNIADRVTDEVKSRMALVKEFLGKEYKGVIPFRQKPMGRQEQQLTYMSLTPKQIAYGLQKQTQFYTQRIQEMLQQYPDIDPNSLYSPEELAREDMNEFIFEQEEILRGKKRYA